MRILSKRNRRGFLGTAAAVVGSTFAPRELFSTVGAAAAGGADVIAVMAGRHFVSIPDLEVAAGKGIAAQRRIYRNGEKQNNRSGSVKYRIAMWASAGFLVAGCWALYAFATAPNQITGIVWTLVRLTCPVVQAGFYFHFGIKLYWVLLANAATYALVGLLVEILRQQLNHAKIIQKSSL